MPNLSRRGFMRVAILGAAGAATVAACPEFIEEALLSTKKYFFMKYRQPGATILIMKARHLGSSSLNLAIMDYHRTVNPNLFPRLAAKAGARFDGGKFIQSPLHWSAEVKRG